MIVVYDEDPHRILRNIWIHWAVIPRSRAFLPRLQIKTMAKKPLLPNVPCAPSPLCFGTSLIVGVN